MNQERDLKSNHRENTSIVSLLLAFFAPFDINNKKVVINSAMIPPFAVIYMIRNGIAALTTCSAGVLLSEAEYPVLGTIGLGLFVIFAGLFGAFLAATVNTHRNPR